MSSRGFSLLGPPQTIGLLETHFRSVFCNAPMFLQPWPRNRGLESAPCISCEVKPVFCGESCCRKVNNTSRVNFEPHLSPEKTGQGVKGEFLGGTTSFHPAWAPAFSCTCSPPSPSPSISPGTSPSPPGPPAVGAATCPSIPRWRQTCGNVTKQILQFGLWRNKTMT